ILSSLNYRGANEIARGHHLRTLDWWKLERKYYSLVTSRHTETELSRGDFDNQATALAACRRLKYLPQTSEVVECAVVYHRAGIVPVKKFGDAIQLATAVIYKVDYLLTWNYSHLANV